MSTHKFIIYAILAVVMFFMLRGIAWLEDFIGERNLWTSSLNLVAVFSMFLLLARLFFCIVSTIIYLLLKRYLHYFADRFFFERDYLLVFRYFIWDMVYDFEPKKERPDKRRNQTG